MTKSLKSIRNMVNFELVGEVKNLLFIFEKGVGQKKKRTRDEPYPMICYRAKKNSWIS